MEQAIKVITDNSVGIGCLIYFMWFNTEIMKKFYELLSNMNTRLSIIEKCLGIDKKVDE